MAGTPSLNQFNPNLMAFAGQLVQPHGHYDQEKNHWKEPQ
jgi:hypothetical protein